MKTEPQQQTADKIEDSPGHQAKLLSMKQKALGKEAYEVVSHYKLPVGESDFIVAYHFSGKGYLDVNCTFIPGNDTLPLLPRMGVSITLNKQFSQMEWLGRGPHENYIDRNTSSYVGLYKGSVADQYFPYDRPQENGNKTEVRWMSLTDTAGQGLMVVGQPYVSTSAYLFPTEDLDEPGLRKSQRHLSDIQFKDMVTWNIDLKQMGVGGDTSWGAYPHHSLHDIAVLRTFPGMNIVLPCDARQTRKLVKLLVDYPEPVYVRVGRAAVPDVYENDDFDFVLGKANMLLDGTDLTIIAAGETVYHAYQAGLILQEKGIKARVLDMSSIKPVDVEAIKKAAEETGRIITVEEHSQFGGLGAIVVETLSENPVPVRIIGIPDENVVHGNSHEIFAHYGLDKEGICKAALPQ